MAVLSRAMQILSIVATHLFAHCCVSLMHRVPQLERWLPNYEPLDKPQRLKNALESLGGGFVKLGQMLAFQPDILPQEYCEALYNLLDKVSPVGVEEIEAVFKEEIGLAPEEALDSFDRKPIASGSIGQVHIGYVDGRKVAVKVQRPDTQSGFHRDIRMMSVLAWTIRTLHIKPLYWMVDPLQEFAEWTVDELDFRREARYMRALRKHAIGCRRQYVPEVVRYATMRVLVIEFLEGITLIDHMRLVAQSDTDHQQWLEEVGFDSHQFAENLIDVFVRGANEGIFHADLHPANLMVMGRPNNVVGYLDCGITGVLSPFSRQNLLATTLAFARGDIDALCTAFFNVSAIDSRSNPDGFRAELKEMSEKWYRGNDEDSKLSSSASTVFMEMLTLSRKHQIWPQRDIIRYIRSAMGVDSLIRAFAPEFDVGKFLASTSKKYLTKHARKSLMSHDALIAWSKATAELSRTGAFRFSTILEQFVNQRTSTASASTRRPERQESVIILIAAGLLLLAFTTNESHAVGVNLFTSQLAVATMFAMTWWKNTYGIPRGTK